MEPDPYRFVSRVGQSLLMFLFGLAISNYLGSTSILCRVLSIVLMTLAGGQQLWLGHECGHNAFTGVPKLDKLFHSFSFGNKPIHIISICITSKKILDNNYLFCIRRTRIWFVCIKLELYPFGTSRYAST